MKIFISWSGERSRHVADGLRDWLPYIFQSIKPWISGKDIDAGARWSRELWGELEATSFGILCVTPENVTAPWLLFEAGALAKVVNEARVIPLLIDLEPVDIPGGPLIQFQAKKASQHGIWEITKSINKSLEQSLPPDRLAETFERWWPDLQQVLDSLPEPKQSLPEKRDIEPMIEEILLAVRGLERSSIDNRYEGASASEVTDTFIKANHWFSIDLGHDLEDDEVKNFLAWIDKYSIVKDSKITEEADRITLYLLSDTRLSKNFLENNMEEIGLRVLKGPY